MAKIAMLIDDIDGAASHASRPVATHTFALDGVEYEIDLHTDNATQMREAFAQYIRVARELSKENRAAALRSAPQVAVTKKAPVDRAQLDAKRKWLRDRGYKVSKYGMIPRDLEAIYARDAHPSSRDNTEDHLFSAAR